MYSKLKPQGERIGCVRSSQNLTKFFFCFLSFVISPRGGRTQASEKSSLFGSVYFCYTKEKTLSTLQCIILHVACDVFPKVKTNWLVSPVN